MTFTQCTSEHLYHIDLESGLNKLQYIDKFVLCYNLTIPRPGSTATEIARGKTYCYSNELDLDDKEKVSCMCQLK